MASARGIDVGEKLADRPAPRDDKLGVEVCKRLEREAALVEPWVGQRQPRLVADEVAVDEEVEVERPRPEADLRRPVAAQIVLDLEEHRQEVVRVELRVERHGAVQIPGLLYRPPGLRLPKPRDAGELDPRLRGEHLDRAADRPFAVPEVRSDADVGTHAADATGRAEGPVTRP